jgi:hypothetical protein
MKAASEVAIATSFATEPTTSQVRPEDRLAKSCATSWYEAPPSAAPMDHLGKFSSIISKTSPALPCNTALMEYKAIP